MNGKKRSSTVLILLLLVVMLWSGAGCSQNGEGTGVAEKPTLVMADAGWDSIRFHNDVAKIIIENGYGYKTDVKMGSTPVTFTGLIQGDIDIYMEVWSDNLNNYKEAIEKGDILELSLNFGDNKQGMYVPTYMIKGDKERGIEAVAPDLKTVEDLPKYWELFKDPEDKSKGRIYGAIPGWAADAIMVKKIENYGLNKNYNLFRPGSDTALSSSMVKAVEEGKPWLGYYWEPTWIMGKYDMTLIEEPAYDKEKWESGYKCEFPSVKVTVCAHKDLTEKAPEVVEFLKKYETSSKLTSDALAYMQDNDMGTEEAAIWFLKNNRDMWSQWVPENIAKSVEDSLK